MRIRSIVTILLFSATASFCFAGNERSRSFAVSPDTALLGREVRQTVAHVIDSTIASHTKELDTLLLTLSLTGETGRRGVQRQAELLILGARDSLSPQRADSLRLAASRFQSELALFSRTHSTRLRNALGTFANSLRAVQATYAGCEDCAKSEDAVAMVDDARIQADSLSQRYVDSLSTLSDDFRDSLRDTVESCRELLQDLCSDMIDRQQDEDEYAAAHSTRLVMSSSYMGHLAYRGRDSGVDEYAVAPQIAYHHRNGLFVAAGASWLEKSASHWDVSNLGIGYAVEFGRSFVGTISYTRFWFSDSSVQQRAELPNSIDGDLVLHSRVVDLEAALSYAFGSVGEFTSAFSVSHALEFDRVFRRGKLTVEPTVTATVGEQNAQLTSSRTRRVVGKKGQVVSVTQTTTSTTNYFGILDYEISIPVSFEFGRLALAPTVVYAIPVNVVDRSSTSPFLYSLLSVSFTIR